MTKEEFIIKINKDRRDNKDYWLFTTEIVNGYQVTMKSYNTWVQLMWTNAGIKYSGPMDCSVKEFNSFISSTLDDMLE